jgi:hypothetical protein
MHSSLSDIRDGVRRYLNREGVSSFVILTLALSIGVTTTIFTVMYAGLMKSLPVARSAGLARLGDPTEEGTANGNPGVSTFSYQADQYLHDHHQHLRPACVSRSGSASLMKKRAGAKSGTLSARTHGPRKQNAAGTRYQAQEGTGYGHSTKRHPFCASQFAAVPGFYGDRTHDAGAGNRDQCGFVFSC